ncbi:MAG: hypothetical protein NT166_23145 [Candidatus Aminicenantes bacterium]|nr:hypothetical protein [Candidatus Aminicenantes bacterium]
MKIAAKNAKDREEKKPYPGRDDLGTDRFRRRWVGLSTAMNCHKKRLLLEMRSC